MWFRTLAEFMEKNGYVIEGRWYPRVTSIISIKSKPALFKFYADASSYSQALSITGRSATQGTKIHNALEAILAGKELEETDEEVRPAVEAFHDFQNNFDIRVNPEAIEQQIHHKIHGYAGTLDALAEINGTYGILDIKTSSGIWRDYNLQTAAYYAALQEPELFQRYHLEPPKTRWILRIDQAARCLRCDARKREKGGRETIKGGGAHCTHEWGPVRGEWELKELTDPIERDFQAFLACKTLWEWENESWLKQIGHV